MCMHLLCVSFCVVKTKLKPKAKFVKQKKGKMKIQEEKSENNKIYDGHWV